MEADLQSGLAREDEGENFDENDCDVSMSEDEIEVEESDQESEEESDEDSEESDEGSDVQSDYEEPAAKKAKFADDKPPEDHVNHAFYERGLYALASIVAYKIKKKSPEYISEVNPVPTDYPVWVEHFSVRGMAPPSAQLIDFVKVMDRNFHNLHGESVQKDKGLVKLFQNHIKVTAPKIPKLIVSVFAKLRILIRVRALNKRNKDQKKVAAQQNKLDKNSRQANVNKVWEHGKM